MERRSVVIKVNSNLHHVAGENLFERDEKCFKEYRKKWEEWPQKFHKGDFPLFIDIEVTNACNLRCVFCATTFESKDIEKGFIAHETFKKIIDEGADKGLYGVKFNIRGEPLLHPKIHEFVRYAKQRGLIDVYFNTNATLLTEEIAGRLIDAGLDRLTISFEGYTKGVYEESRVGANYESVLKNIETLKALKKKLGVKNPRTRIQMVLLPGLESIIEGYRDFWMGRVDEIAFLDYKEMRNKRFGMCYPWACPQLWQRMGVWWDGTILPCNHDDLGLLSLGNVQEISIKAAWNSKELNACRDKHKLGLAHLVLACDGCCLRDSEITKLMKLDKTKKAAGEGLEI